MARLARVIAPGMPYHVTQWGNRRQQTFFGLVQTPSRYRWSSAAAHLSFEVALFFDVCGLKEGASSFLRIWAKWC